MTHICGDVHGKNFTKTALSIGNLLAEQDTLIPTLDDQVKQILNPLKTSVENLETKLKASDAQYKDLELKHDDLEQYSRRQNVRIGPASFQTHFRFLENHFIRPKRCFI